MKLLTILGLLATLAIASAAPDPAPANTEKAYFAAGCFWCMEGLFERVPGVIEVVSGYAGGTTKDPTYEVVGSGRTGHAESIEIVYDPAKVTYPELLTWFWKSHDPTNPRGVAPDFGTQYRSALFYTNDEQKQAIEKSRAEWQTKVSKPIATEVAPLSVFYPAEAYHQDYVKNHPNAPYVRNVSLPRINSVGLP